METKNSHRSYGEASTKPFPLKIYVSRVVDFSRLDMNLVLRQISLRGRNKAMRISNPMVRDRSLTAEFLLWHALTNPKGIFSDESVKLALRTGYDTQIKQPGITEDNSPHFDNIWGLSEIPDIEETSDGKPYLKNYPNIGFSLSHSGAYVLCAVGCGTVGADIQKKAVLRSDVAGRFYTDAERRYIDLSVDPTSAFYHIWVLKESYVKYTGRGLAEGIESFNVISDSFHGGYNNDRPDSMDRNDQHVIDRFHRIGFNRCEKNTFRLDIEHSQGKKLQLAVYDMNVYAPGMNKVNGCDNKQDCLDRYAIGVCYPGNIDMKPQIIDIQNVTDKLQLQGGSL